MKDLPLVLHTATPAKVQESDILLVQAMNPSQREIQGPPSMHFLPEWARRDAQLIANYRAKAFREGAESVSSPSVSKLLGRDIIASQYKVGRK